MDKKLHESKKAGIAVIFGILLTALERLGDSAPPDIVYICLMVIGCTLILGQSAVDIFGNKNQKDSEEG